MLNIYLELEKDRFENTFEYDVHVDSELNITEGALYPALHKLEADGLLDVEVAKVGNRLRKYYKLTENGTKETANKLEEMQEFLKTMQHLVNPKFILE